LVGWGQRADGRGGGRPVTGPGCSGLPPGQLPGNRPPGLFARGRCAEGMGEAHPVTVAAAPGSAPEQAPGLQRCAGAAAAEGGQRFLPPAMPPSTPRMIWLPTLVPTGRMADLVIASR